MGQLYQDMCRFLTAIEDDYETFNNERIQVKNGQFKGLDFVLGPAAGQVGVNKKFTIHFEQSSTSVLNLLLLLYTHKIIGNECFDLIADAGHPGLLPPFYNAYS